MTSHGNRSDTSRTVRTVISMAAIATFAAGVTALAFSPFALIVIPGVIGGLIAAVILWRRGRHAPPSGPVRDVFGSDVSSTDVINFATIRVAGVGGLGVVIVALAVALQYQRVGLALAIGLAGGALAAGLLIVRRRQTGLSGGGGDPRARTILGRGEDAAAADTSARASDDDPHVQRRSPSAAPSRI